MARAVVVLFRDDGGIEVGHTDQTACLHMTRLQYKFDYSPTSMAILDRVRDEVKEAMRFISREHQRK